MNKSIINEMTYYENDDIPTIEKAILAETLKFSTLEPIEGKFFIPATIPSIDTEELTTKKNAKYTESNYVELVIPPHLLLMFMKPQIVPVTDFIDKLKHIPEKCEEECEELGHKITGNKIEFVKYGPCRNKIKYVLGFESNSFSIPKGTEFLIEFLGGHMEIDHMAIIGIYSLATNT